MTGKGAKRILAVLGFLALLFVVERVVDYFVLPVSNMGMASIQSRRENEGHIDTVFLGASLAADSVIPDVIDQTLGSRSFNLSTNAQSMRMSYYALRDVLVKNDVKRAIVEVSVNRMSRDVEEQDGLAKIAFVDYLINQDAHWSYIRDNYSLDELPRLLLISMRCQLKFLVSDLGQRFDLDYLKHYLKNGYAIAKDHTVRPGGRGFIKYTSKIKRGNAGAELENPSDATEVYTTEEGRENEKELRRIAELCEQHGVELTLITIPASDTWFLSYADSYQQMHEYFAGLAAELGVAYYNFCYAPELQEQLKDKHFKDTKHMNAEGAAVFSPYLANVLKNGPGPDTFCETYGEAVAGFDRVVGVSLRKSRAGGQNVLAISRQRQDIEPEYRFYAKPRGAQNDQYKVIQEYSASERCPLTDLARGRYTLRVEARAKGVSEREYDAYTNIDVTVK